MYKILEFAKQFEVFMIILNLLSLLSLLSFPIWKNNVFNESNSLEKHITLEKNEKIKFIQNRPLKNYLLVFKPYIYSSLGITFALVLDFFVFETSGIKGYLKLGLDNNLFINRFYGLIFLLVIIAAPFFFAFNSYSSLCSQFIISTEKIYVKKLNYFVELALSDIKNVKIVNATNFPTKLIIYYSKNKKIELLIFDKSQKILSFLSTLKKENSFNMNAPSLLG